MKMEYIENLNLTSDIGGNRASRELPLKAEAYLRPYKSRIDEIMLANVPLVANAKEKDTEKIYRSKTMVSMINKAACNGFAVIIMGPPTIMRDVTAGARKATDGARKVSAALTAKTSLLLKGCERRKLM